MDAAEFLLHSEIEDTHWWFRARREIVFEFLRERIPPGVGKTVVEIGCGTGGNMRFLRAHYRIVGVDTSPEAIRLAVKLGAEEALLGDFRTVLDARWPDIDGALLLDVLEHVRDDRAFFRDLYDRLSPGASIVLTVPGHPFLFGPHDTALGHLRRYTRRSLHDLWKGLDATVHRVTQFNAVFTPLIVPFRLFERVRNRLFPYGRRSDLKPPGTVANALLYRLFSVERYWLRRFPIGWGISHIAVLSKPGRTT